MGHPIEDELTQAVVASIVEQLPEVDVYGKPGGQGVRFTLGRRSIDFRVNNDQPMITLSSGNGGLLGSYDDAYQAAGAVIDFFTNREQWDDSQRKSFLQR